MICSSCPSTCVYAPLTYIHPSSCHLPLAPASVSLPILPRPLPPLLTNECRPLLLINSSRSAWRQDGHRLCDSGTIGCYDRQQSQRQGHVRVERVRHLCYCRLYHYRQRSQCQGRVRVERMRQLCYWRLYITICNKANAKGVYVWSVGVFACGALALRLRGLSVSVYLYAHTFGHHAYIICTHTHSLSLSLPLSFSFSFSLFLSFSLSLSHVLDYQEPPGRSSACVVTSVTGKQPHQAIQTENFRHHRNCWRLLIVSRL